MHLCKRRLKKRRTPAAYHLLRELGFFIPQAASSVKIHHTAVAFFLCTTFEARYSPEISVMSRRFDDNPYFGAVAEFVYSQVSRLSLSMCDPERTVSMSIRRSELRPSGMQGISSSLSDIGSTGIDSCKVIEEVSPESPVSM